MKSLVGEQFDIEVTRVVGAKCPRCWRIMGIPENYLGMCDRCCSMLLEGLPDLVKAGQLTEDEGQMIKSEIDQHHRQQLEKYRKCLSEGA